MKKYYLGLTAIAVVVLGLTIYIMYLGVQGRQDKETYEKATKIASKLNNYVSDNRKIPASLEEAGIDDVPDTISYTKKSSSTYEFCTTFKSSRGYGAGNVTDVVTGDLLPDQEITDEDYTYDYEASYLYINYSYTNGENCQTIKPYTIRTYEDDSSSGSQDDTLYQKYCSTESLREQYEYYCTYYESADVQDGANNTDEL